MLGANPVYLLCRHLQHVSILPEKHRLLLAFDSVQCSLPGLIIIYLFSFPTLFVQSDSDLFSTEQLFRVLLSGSLSHVSPCSASLFAFCFDVMLICKVGQGHV